MRARAFLGAPLGEHEGGRGEIDGQKPRLYGNFGPMFAEAEAACDHEVDVLERLRSAAIAGGSPRSGPTEGGCPLQLHVGRLRFGSGRDEVEQANSLGRKLAPICLPIGGVVPGLNQLVSLQVVYKASRKLPSKRH